jgi:hypothetical protein
MRLLRAALLGAVCGIAWWGVFVALGGRSYGIAGTHPVTGGIASIITGVVIACVSLPAYRLPVRQLLWYSPLSVYLAIGCSGLLIHALRVALSDFHPGEVPWKVGLQSILGMWWGVTFLLPVPVVVHVCAYANHWILRRLLMSPTAVTNPP